MRTSNNSKLWLVIAIVLVLMGIGFLVAMPRQEDPLLKERFGSLVYIYPGATAETISKLVVKPIEDELAEVGDVKTVKATARSQSGILEITLNDSTTDLNEAWNDVDEALDKASRSFPAGVYLDQKSKGLELESIVLGVRGGAALIDTLDYARRLREELLKDKDVAKVKLIGQTNEEIAIEVSNRDLNEKGISLWQLTELIQSGNSAQASGSVSLTDRKAELISATSFSSLESIKNLRIPILSGDSVPLKELADVKRSFKFPQDKEFRYQGEPVIGLGVVARDSVNIVEFGQRVRSIVDSFRRTNRETVIFELAYQPARTEIRLNELIQSLVIGIVTVVFLLMFWMGWSTSLIVGLSIPSITLIGLAVYGVAGGVLHQISIAAFVVSIGQFIDNIIVIVEGTQRKIAAGVPKTVAIEQTQAEFKRPMVFATGTGIAAFIPMLAAQGPTADFTSAFPIVAILTLVISYFFAIYVTPALISYGMNPIERDRSIPGLALLTKFFVLLAQRRAGRVLALALMLLLASGVVFTQVGKQFFPASDRNEFIFNVELLDGAPFGDTQKLASLIEKRLLSDSRVKELVTTIGGGMPRFYYNLPTVFESPHVAQFLITTHDKQFNHLVGRDLETWINLDHPEAVGTARYLEQGPPVLAPVELRVYGQDTNMIYGAIQELRIALSNIEGTRMIRDSLGLGSPRFRIDPWDQNGSQLNFGRTQLSLALLKETQGIPLGTYRGGEELVPITLRSPQTKEATIGDILATQVFQSRDRSYTMDQFASFQLVFAPSVIERRNRQAYYAVLSDLDPLTSFSQVMTALRPKLLELEKKYPVRIEVGGESEGSGEANLSILKVIPIATLILIMCLMAEFNSFRKILIVFVALPFVLTGIAPGLWLSQTAFGFMSLLGVLALMGIVVNNVILILEALQSHYEEGLGPDEVIRLAITSRIKPIVLTTILTLAGLLPLALEDSSLWPPMAWAMISGLIASTFFTLVVVPTLFRVLFFTRSGSIKSRNRPSVSQLGILLVMLVCTGMNQTAFAQIATSLDDLLTRSEKSQSNQAIDFEYQAAQQKIERLISEAHSPQVTLEGSVQLRDREIQTLTPFGSNKVENQNITEARLQLTWPIYNARLMLHEKVALDHEAQAIRYQADYQVMVSRVKAGEAIYELAKVRALRQALKKSLSTLNRRKEEVKRYIILGRLGQGDLARLELDRSRMESQLFELGEIEASFSSLLKGYSIEPAEVPAELNKATIVQISLDGLRMQTRSDVRSLNMSEEALLAKALGADASFLPEVAFFAASTRSDRADFVDPLWNEVGLNFRWKIYDSGSRRAEKSIYDASRQALTAQRNDAIQRIQDGIAAETATMRTLLDRQERTHSLLSLANSSVASERKRFSQGRGTLQELLSSESLLREIEVELARLPYDIYKFCLRMQILQGLKPRSQCQGLIASSPRK